jgi:hypothetical protein
MFLAGSFTGQLLRRGASVDQILSACRGAARKPPAITSFGARNAQGLNFAVPADWIAELESRNRDRMERRAVASAGVTPRPGQTRPPARGPAADSHAGETVQVGDRWRYRLSSGPRNIGTVSVDIEEVSSAQVKERDRAAARHQSAHYHALFLCRRHHDGHLRAHQVRTRAAIPGCLTRARSLPRLRPRDDPSWSA